MKEKAIIIGSSTTGKTTLLKYFQQNTQLPVLESDDELTRMNGGTYPRDSVYKINQLAPAMVQVILGRDKVIFFTNTHYFQADDLVKARKLGFAIIQLSLDRAKMTARSKYREENEGYEDHTKYFDDMFDYQSEILGTGLVDQVIDTDRPVQEIATELLAVLESS